jgi:deoxyribodipyrimidine photo-lyase
VPGEQAASTRAQDFIKTKLAAYGDKHNDPTEVGQSNLSPYLHFGHLSAQRLALLVLGSSPSASGEMFLEELIVRRELADNFCYYESNYDNPQGFPIWAQKTIAEQATTSRAYLYTRAQLEKALTHDDLWNAAQHQLVATGKMHGYMRMYWAKKILEWTKSAEQAMAFAIYLNDKYELDGRDPNGYAGIAWSIGGVHDRAWFNKPVFGKIRYMSYNGCKSKFAIDRYIDANK